MGGGGKRPSPRHWILLGAVVLLVLAVVLPPLVSIGRYQHRIAASISRSIGQPVHMSSVKLQLLPRPGFELTGLCRRREAWLWGGADPSLRQRLCFAAALVAVARRARDCPHRLRRGESESCARCRWHLELRSILVQRRIPPMRRRASILRARRPGFHISRRPIRASTSSREMRRSRFRFSTPICRYGLQNRR